MTIISEIYAAGSGVSRKYEWEGTKCQKFTGNEIHWERIHHRIPLSKFFVLNISAKGLAKNQLFYIARRRHERKNW